MVSSMDTNTDSRSDENARVSGSSIKSYRRKQKNIHKQMYLLQKYSKVAAF
jgi:hypothetical protein